MTAIVHPEHPLDPTELDRYLTEGWRPTGQYIYTSDFLRTDDDEIHGCIQLRLPLANFAFRKRQRKLLNRNGRRFTHVIEPLYAIDEEIRRVNRAYMREHPEKSRDDIEFQLFTPEGLRSLDTWIVRVFEGHSLVAFSLFDLGERTMYSKAGIYDPEYRPFGMGRYTMLLELRFALERGLTHYHPGYFSPTEPVFNYKLTLGPTEYHDVLTRQWRPLPHADGSGITDPLVIVRQRLAEAEAALVRAGFSRVYLREYVSYTANFAMPGGRYLDAPALLYLEMEGGEYQLLLYNLDRQQYELRLPRWSPTMDMRRKNVSAAGVPRLRVVLWEGELLASAREAAALPALVYEYS